MLYLFSLLPYDLFREIFNNSLGGFYGRNLQFIINLMCKGPNIKAVQMVNVTKGNKNGYG